MTQAMVSRLVYVLQHYASMFQNKRRYIYSITLLQHYAFSASRLLTIRIFHKKNVNHHNFFMKKQSNMNMLHLLTTRKEVNSVTKKSHTKLLSPGGWPYEYLLLYSSKKVHFPMIQPVCLVIVGTLISGEKLEVTSNLKNKS